MKTKEKNAAAVAMGKARWKNVSPEDRTRFAHQLLEKRRAKRKTFDEPLDKLSNDELIERGSI